MNDTNLTDILEIKPPLVLETGEGSGWALWVLLVLFVAGGVLLFWALREPKRAPVLPAPDAEALRKLREVWGLLPSPVLFAQAVADILRVYLGDRFEFHAPERTTEEFLGELHRAPQMTPPQKDLLGQFLEFCDLSKFARHEPTEEDCRRLHAMAIKLVKETAPPLPGALPPRVTPPQLTT